MLTNYLQGIGTNAVLQVGPNPAGGVLFVSSVNGSDNRGRVTFPGATSSTTGGSLQGPQMDPTRPLATLAYALSLTVAGRGDTVVLLQGHTETLTANVTCSTAGTLIVGLGMNDERPTLTMGGFSIVMSGVGSLIQNVICAGGAVANTTGIIQLTGAGTTARNNKISISELTSIPFLLSGNGSIADSNEVDATTTGCVIGFSLGASARAQVTNNLAYGIFNTGVIDTGTATNFYVYNNTFRQLSATTKPVISGVVTANSGIFEANTYQSVAATTPAEFLTGTNVTTNIGVIYVQNYGFKGKAGPSSGILIPAVGTIP